MIVGSEGLFPKVSVIEAQRRVTNVGNYELALDALELPPNGDDYNAVMAMMKGGPYTPPHTEGR